MDVHSVSTGSNTEHHKKGQSTRKAFILDDYLGMVCYALSVMCARARAPANQGWLKSTSKRCNTPLYRMTALNDRAARAMFLQFDTASRCNPGQYDHTREVSRVSLA